LEKVVNQKAQKKATLFFKVGTQQRLGTPQQQNLHRGGVEETVRGLRTKKDLTTQKRGALKADQEGNSQRENWFFTHQIRTKSQPRKPSFAKKNEIGTGGQIDRSQL